MKKSSNIIEEYIIEGYHEEPLVVDKIEQKLFQLSSYVSKYNMVDNKSFSFVPRKGYYLNNERVKYKNLPLYGYTKADG